MSEIQDAVDMLDLVLFTDRFARLIDFGIGLVRCFEVMREDATASMAGPLRSVQSEIEAGSTLSRAMRMHPTLFPPLYTAMVRAGEVGGMLELSLEALALWIEEEWKAERAGGPTGSAALLYLDPAASSWDELSPMERRFLLMLFCRSLSDLIAAGCPLRRALGAAADFLPAAESRAVVGVGETLPPDADGQIRLRFFMMPAGGLAGPLTALGFLPQLITAPMMVAERNDLGVTSMAPALDTAAQILRKQVRLELLAGRAQGGRRR